MKLSLQWKLMPRGFESARVKPLKASTVTCQLSWLQGLLLHRTRQRRFFPSSATTHCAIWLPVQDGQAELAWVAGYIARWFTWPEAVINLSTNWTARRVPLLIKTKALPLHHTSKSTQHPRKVFFRRIFTLRTKLSGAAYCNRSCLWVCVFVGVCVVCVFVGLLPR